MQPGMMQPGMMQPGMQPGMMQPDVVMMQPDMMMMQPGMMQPGMPMGSAPGAPTPGMEPFDEAKARAQAKEERAQAAKQREKMGRLKAAEVERDRKISRSSSCVIWIVAMAFIFNVLLIIPLTGQNWGYRSFTGLGIKAMHFRTSIFMMEVEVLCGKNWLEDYLCKAGVKANGKHTLQQAVGIMCAISDSACSEMNRIYIASYILLVGEVIVCLLLLAGAGCIFYYWNSDRADAEISRHGLNPALHLAARWDSVADGLGADPPRPRRVPRRLHAGDDDAHGQHALRDQVHGRLPVWLVLLHDCTGSRFALGLRRHGAVPLL
eukprot:CAMPEP_0115532054 /NCGR_PEP_ID=MMETSP0271-20121206/85381_1 /TAXON_ID=71861 /ORGANISM="Scrippsiella trochoidea, Strain CCMP3099" /LENGTH=320 /DNA_ID=CAMNT_0002964339 /DNA_START=104 /DNA_END=1062 /DNA_ORIENTATION=+